MGWFLLRRVVDLFRDCFLHVISRNHSNEFFLINLTKKKKNYPAQSKILQQMPFVLISGFCPLFHAYFNDMQINRWLHYQVVSRELFFAASCSEKEQARNISLQQTGAQGKGDWGGASGVDIFPIKKLFKFSGSNQRSSNPRKVFWKKSCSERNKKTLPCDHSLINVYRHRHYFQHSRMF